MSVPVTEQGYASGTSWWDALAAEETPEVAWPLSVSVYDKMRRQDAQVMSVLRAVTLPVRRTTWRVAAGSASPEVTRFVADDLGLGVEGQADVAPVRTRDRFSWSEHIRLALLSLPFGHSFFEQTYRPDLTTKRYHLRKLGWRPPKTIDRVEVASDGGLVGIHQAGMKGKELITVDRLVAYVNEREGGNWLGQSLLRSAYKFWLIKDPALRTWAMTIDRNGLGVPIYTGGPIPDAIAELGEDAIKAWQAQEKKDGLALATQYRGGKNAGGYVGNGAKLGLQGVDGQLPKSDPLVRYCDEQIARAVLANFLNLGGDNSTGSYALGDTFANFFVQSLQTVAQQHADVATQHIVEDLVDINFGTSEPAPRIVFDEIGSRHELTAEAIAALIQCKALTPDESLERHIRTRGGLPEAEPTTARATTAPTTEEAA